MLKKTVHFMGLLANVDSSILRMSFDHGFRVEDMSDDDGQRLISVLEGLPYVPLLEKLAHLQCLNVPENRFYFITNSFESDIKITDQGVLIDLPSEVVRFNNSFLEGYLKPLIRLMRLFKQGDIRMPLTYYYVIEKGTPRSFLLGSTGVYVTPEPYKLESSEVPELLIFIRNTKLPFANPFLQLAFENFELSYQTPNINLSFLSLMISLETLFNPGDRELRYRLSRNTAVLLGKGNGDSKSIFSEVKDLYDKRSNIVHTGRSNIINKEDLLKLRYYVRGSIKEIDKIRKNKSELLDLLNTCGFGERPWRK